LALPEESAEEEERPPLQKDRCGGVRICCDICEDLMILIGGFDLRYWLSQ